MAYKVTTVPAAPANPGYWEFRQNNSGGWFVKEFGHLTLIWAKTPEDANHAAEQHGIYFDGCSRGRDCPCCGDRWSKVGAWGDAKPDYPDITVDALVAELTREIHPDPEWGAIQNPLEYAARWGLGIRIIGSDGAVHWLRKDEP